MPRALEWHDTLFDQTLGSAAQAGIDLLSNLARNERSGATITRIILNLMFDAQLTQNQDILQVVDMGIGVFSEDAAVASAFSDPDTEIDQPARGWLYRGRGMVRLEIGENLYEGVRVDKDIRAQRRLDRGVLYLVVDSNTTEGTSATIVLRGLVRVLMRMP